VSRRSLFATLTLLGALLAPPGRARAQSVPAPIPPRVEAAAVPLVPDAAAAPERPEAAHKVIATSRPVPVPIGMLPVPDDGLTSGPYPARSGTTPSGTPTPGVRTAVYRPETDLGSVQQVSAPDGRPAVRVAPPAPRAATGARVSLRVERPSEVEPAKPFAYAIHVLSDGDTPAASVRVTDRLPAGARLVSAEPKPEIAGDRLTWDLGQLPPGTERVVRLTLVAEQPTGNFVVSPIASFSTPAALRVAAARSLLEIHLTGPETVQPGGATPFRVQVANNGSAPLSRVHVLVRLTPGLRHPQMGRGDAIEAEISLAPGETKTLPLDLTAGAAGPNVIAASARTEIGGLTAEARAAVNVDPNAPGPAALLVSAAARVSPGPGVEINNLSEGATIDAMLVYEIKVRNPADAPQTGIRLVAALPEGLEAEQADGPTASAVSPHGVVFETLQRLGPGESAVYHLRVRTLRAGVQRVRVEVNEDNLAQPASAETSTWVAPGRGRS
jgi:hypothetical protein